MYNQFFPQSQGFQPQNFQQQQPQPFQSQTNIGWIPVNGIQSVKEYIVKPNEKLWFMDNNEPMFYVKVGDALGNATIEAYMFEKINLSDVEPKYITVAEFEEFKKSLKKEKKEN